MPSPDAVRRLTVAARRNGGIITRGDALKLGAPDSLLGRLVGLGSFRRLHPGVYLLAGSPEDHRTATRAALAAAGPAAVASHTSAACLQGLTAAPRSPHITVPNAKRPKLSGVEVHHTSRLPRVQIFQGVRCTDPARTLVDIAAGASPGELAAALDVALSRGQVRLRDVERQTRLAPHRPGSTALRKCLEELGHVAGPSPSVLENRMARLLTRHGLPRPQAEVRAGRDGRYRIDYAYRDCRLAIEVYGYIWHHSPEQMKYDLARQRALILDGWIVLVYTWLDVNYDAARVAKEIGTARARALTSADVRPA